MRVWCAGGTEEHIKLELSRTPRNFFSILPSHEDKELWWEFSAEYR